MEPMPPKEDFEDAASDLIAAQRALSRINERGLVYAHRRDFAEAREAIDQARPLVAQRAPAGGGAP